MEDADKPMFVPIKRNKKRKNTAVRSVEDSIKLLLDKVSTKLDEDPTEKMLVYFEKENELARQHEMKLFSMMFGRPQFVESQTRPARSCTPTQGNLQEGPGDFSSLLCNVIKNRSDLYTQLS